MVGGRRILVVVPARAGSTGVRHKNIHPLAGRPLIAHTGDLVGRLPWVDRAVVSTDGDAIAAAAMAAGLDAPFRRPEALGGPRIGDWDVLHHALVEMERIDQVEYDVVVMLQPTCPLRRPEHVRSTVDTLIDGGWQAVWTVTETDLKFHPLKALTIAADGRMDYADPRGAGILARQQLTPTYHRNGAAYALTRAALMDGGSLMGQAAGAVVIRDPLVNIDTIDDFARAEGAMAGESS